MTDRQYADASRLILQHRNSRAEKVCMLHSVLRLRQF